MNSELSIHSTVFTTIRFKFYLAKSHRLLIYNINANEWLVGYAASFNIPFIFTTCNLSHAVFYYFFVVRNHFSVEINPNHFSKITSILSATSGGSFCFILLLHIFNTSSWSLNLLKFNFKAEKKKFWASCFVILITIMAITDAGLKITYDAVYWCSCWC